LDQSLFLLRGDDPVLAVLASNPLTAMLSAALTRKIHHVRFFGHFSLKYMFYIYFFPIFFSVRTLNPLAGPISRTRKSPRRQKIAAFDQRISKRLPGPEKRRFSKI
jgi:hypothetical protein